MKYRCRYSDCANQYRVATDDERITCPLCQDYLGLGPLEEDYEDTDGATPEDGSPPPREVRIEDALNAVGMLLVILLIPAEAGGLPEAEAQRIHKTVMDAYCNLNMAAFEEMLLPDIIKKWVPMALPFARLRDVSGLKGDC